MTSHILFLRGKIQTRACEGGKIQNLPFGDLRKASDRTCPCSLFSRRVWRTWSRVVSCEAWRTWMSWHTLASFPTRGGGQSCGRPFACRWSGIASSRPPARSEGWWGKSWAWAGSERARWSGRKTCLIYRLFPESKSNYLTACWWHLLLTTFTKNAMRNEQQTSRSNQKSNLVLKTQAIF